MCLSGSDEQKQIAHGEDEHLYLCSSSPHEDLPSTILPCRKRKGLVSRNAHGTMMVRAVHEMYDERVPRTAVLEIRSLFLYRERVEAKPQRQDAGLVLDVDNQCLMPVPSRD